jgi:hypothetical protein
MDICPIVHGGKANFTSMIMSPQSGPAGTTFTIYAVYKVAAPLGPGLIWALVNVPDDSIPITDMGFQEGQPPGEYTLQTSKFTLATGVYTVQVFVCEGDCFKTHPNGAIYATANTTFILH